MMVSYPISPMSASPDTLSEQGQSPRPPPPTLGESPQASVEDQLVAMLLVEQSYAVKQITCSRHQEFTSSDDVVQLPHEEWRRKICEWSYKVVDHFRYDREVVSVAMNFFDRFLVLHKTESKTAAFSCQCPSCQRKVDSRTFQLAAMTALYLAIKLHAETGADHEFHPHSAPGAHARRSRRKKLKLYSFVDLSRGQFSPEDICSMERTMLSTLQWKLNPTSPMMVVTYLLRSMPPLSAIPSFSRRNYDLVLHVINELSRYMTELSVCLAKVSSVYLPSQIAYASILISMDMLTTEALPLEVRDSFCETVARISSLGGGEGIVSLVPSDETIRFLRDRLRNCFLPEMLMDDCEIEQSHPISIARDAGLLDMSVHARPMTKQERNNSATSVMDQARQELIGGARHHKEAVYVSP